MLPGFTSHIIVSLTLTIPGMILGETSLSFLGLGVQPPRPTWGNMINQARRDIKLNVAQVFWPSLVLSVTVLSLKNPMFATVPLPNFFL